MVKVAATVWLVLQPDATTVTANPRGRVIYYAGKISPILFVAVLLARACIQGSSADIALWAVLLVIVVVEVIVVVRQRAEGTWYGYAHAIRQRRRR